MLAVTVTEAPCIIILNLLISIYGDDFYIVRLAMVITTDITLT